MLDFLLVRDLVSSVVFLRLLHLCIVIYYLALEVLNLIPSVLVEVMHHVLLNLEPVALDFGLLELLLALFYDLLDLGASHSHVLVFGFLLGAGSLLLFTSTSFLFAGHFC